MKKLLVVFLAIAMIFALATTAMAADTRIPDYVDVNADTDYAVDIYRLTALGVLEGNEGWGKAYRPGEYLTRAEFAKIAMYMFGAEDRESYYAALQSAYGDVYEGFWAEGWINGCADLGLMIGRGNNVFDAQSNVTMQEVATVVLRAVGYDENLPGVWPQKYIDKAAAVTSDGAKTTLMKYVDFVGAKAATRGEMAALVNYALDLYTVQYVKDDYTVVLGISEMDKDGYAYVAWKTNEQLYWDNVEHDSEGHEYVDLLWKVFHAREWNETFEQIAEKHQGTKFIEAAGWSFEDFEDGELAFIFEDYEGVHSEAVASDYYVFGAQLWEMGGHKAGVLYVFESMNVWSDDAEIIFAEITSEAVYDEDDNVVNYKDGSKTYYTYDYEKYAKVDLNIVKSIKDKDHVTMHFDNVIPTEETFCLLDECKYHSERYLILKDGALVGADELEKDDVVYSAGPLVGDDFPWYVGCCADLYDDDGGKDNILLYIAYSPEDAELEKVYTATSYKVDIDGETYTYINDSRYPNAVSYDNGSNYGKIVYHDLYDAMDADNFDGDVKFVPAYARGYVGTLIFEGKEDTTTYGVITELKTKSYQGQPFTYTDYDYGNPVNVTVASVTYAVPTTEAGIPTAIPDGYIGWEYMLTGLNLATVGDTDLSKGIFSSGGFTLASDNQEYAILGYRFTYYPVKRSSTVDFVFYEITLFGADGKPHTYDLDGDYVSFGDGLLENQFKVGDLVQYDLNDDEEVIVEVMVDGRDAANTYPSNDEGYVSFNPGRNFVRLSVDEDGQLNRMGQGADRDYYGYRLTKDTVVFLVEANVHGDGQNRTFSFEDVELGKAEDFIGVDTYARQRAYFETDGKDITVLYLVNGYADEAVQYGLAVASYSTPSGYFVDIHDGKEIVTVELTKAAYDDLDLNGGPFYVAYKLKNGKIDTIFDTPDANLPDWANTPFDGTLIALVDFEGFYIDSDDAERFMKDERGWMVESVDKIDELRSSTNKDTIYFDVLGGNKKDGYLFDPDHSGLDTDADYIAIGDTAGNTKYVLRIKEPVSHP